MKLQDRLMLLKFRGRYIPSKLTDGELLLEVETLSAVLGWQSRTAMLKARGKSLGLQWIGGEDILGLAMADDMEGIDYMIWVYQEWMPEARVQMERRNAGLPYAKPGTLRHQLIDQLRYLRKGQSLKIDCHGRKPSTVSQAVRKLCADMKLLVRVEVDKSTVQVRRF